MELQRKSAGSYVFLYQPLTTDVYVKQIGAEWEIEIYKYKHFAGSLEISEEGNIYIVEDMGLSLKEVGEKTFEIL